MGDDQRDGADRATDTDSFDAAELGRAVREARTRQGMSVRGLARELGCSASLISQLERGINAPSVGLLYRLAQQLDVSVDTLLALTPASGAPMRNSGEPGGEPADRLDLLRALPPSPQPQIQRRELRRAVSFANGVRWERLTPTADPGADLLEIVYPPGSSSTEGELVAHAGWEYGVMLDGELQILFENDQITLGPGDSISFDSEQPHRFSNAGAVEAHAVWMVLGGGET